MPAIRRGQASDLAAVAAIEAASPGAAQWNAAQWNAAQWGGDSCLTHEFLVATEEGDVAGFLIGRAVAPGEREVLNLAVAPNARRKGVGRSLIRAFTKDFPGAVFLEVRESNTTAVAFYESLGFQPVGRREKYYDYPLEAAIVMKFHSC